MANELDETAPRESRSNVFKAETEHTSVKGALKHIKNNPKSDTDKPDSRLEELNRRTFF